MARMTEGEHRVGVDFNPSGSGEVDEIKLKTAALIDHIEAIASDDDHPGAYAAREAMTHYEAAAMWATKAIMKRPNE